MSEPTFYREATNQEIRYKPNRNKGARKMWVVPVEPDPEAVVTEYLVKRGVPRDDAWMAAHHLIHTVLYCLSADSLTGIGDNDEPS